jgi:hypothetical protein
MSIFTNNLITKEHYQNTLVNDDMKKYIDKKTDTLDRQIIMTNNYSIINKNNVTVLKYLTIVLFIMNVVYVGVKFRIIHKSIAPLCMSILTVIFVFILMIIVIKNKRLYKMDMEQKYYPKTNPYNILDKLKKKNGNECDVVSNINLSDFSSSELDNLKKILENIKKTIIDNQLFSDPKNSETYNIYIKDINTLLKSITHFDYIDNQYGPYTSVNEIDIEIKKWREISTTIDSDIVSINTIRLADLKNQQNNYNNKLKEILDNLKKKESNNLYNKTLYKKNKKYYDKTTYEINKINKLLLKMN